MSTAVQLARGAADPPGVPSLRPLLVLLALCLPAAIPAPALAASHPVRTVARQADDPADADEEADDAPADVDAEADPELDDAPVGDSQAPDDAAGDEDDDGSELPGEDPLAPMVPEPPRVRTATVAGPVARLRTDGRAAIPRGAPRRIRALIAAANEIVGKPYRSGGGHRHLVDRGYDCSGAVSYALRGAGLLDGAQDSGHLARWGVGGQGRWLTVEANRGHAFLEVAGLRLDTSATADPTGLPGVRWRPVVGRRARFHARHPVGL